mmetsp:Transcript_28939/g.39754  ORF Transcript_28939/g.39754 Transcript_28939/m.39754 type:complete len:223 (+) Transcript_28939:21-689(+)
MNSLLSRIAAAESRLVEIESKTGKKTKVDDVKQDLFKLRILSARFQRVPDNYYQLNLSERANILNCNISQLCKSIVFVNTAHCADSNHDDITNSLYYLVIVQYIAKINTNYLRTLVHEFREKSQRLSKKKFHFQLAPNEISEKLTGFGHNAICPFGLSTPMPIILCRRCTQVSPSLLVLGGGEIDMKLIIPLSDILRTERVIVGDISDLREIDTEKNSFDED